jgi:hypothetical protein
MLPNWFWEKLAAEQAMIAAAPFHFIFALIILGFIGWWILRFFYRERLEAQNDLIGIYKDKFGPINSDGKSPLGKLRNRKLQDKAEFVAVGIDRLIEVRNRATTETNAAAIIGASQHVMARYEKEFKSDAILIRAEMQSRIVSNGITDPGPAMMGMGAIAYEYPTNNFGLKEVASDLRRLSRLLP